jgi:hypothetical protein
MNKFIAIVSVAAAGLMAAGTSFAEAIDVTAVKADIIAQAAPIALIGGAVLAIAVGVKAFKWVRAALS